MFPVTKIPPFHIGIVSLFWFLCFSIFTQHYGLFVCEPARNFETWMFPHSMFTYLPKLSKKRNMIYFLRVIYTFRFDNPNIKPSYLALRYQSSISPICAFVSERWNVHNVHNVQRCCGAFPRNTHSVAHRNAIVFTKQLGFIETKCKKNEILDIFGDLLRTRLSQAAAICLTF